MDARDEQIQAAARWLVATPKSQRPRPATVELCAKFGLKPIEVIGAVRLANVIRGRAP